MGVRYPSVAVATNVGVLAASGAESLIMTTPPLTLPLDSAQVFIFFWFMGNSGVGTTALNPRIRRGAALTSALVNIGNVVPVAANTQVSLSGCYVDTPGAGAGLQYSFTLAGSATTGAGSFVDGAMLAFAL